MEKPAWEKSCEPLVTRCPNVTATACHRKVAYVRQPPSLPRPYACKTNHWQHTGKSTWLPDHSPDAPIMLPCKNWCRVRCIRLPDLQHSGFGPVRRGNMIAPASRSRNRRRLADFLGSANPEGKSRIHLEIGSCNQRVLILSKRIVLW